MESLPPGCNELALITISAFKFLSGYLILLSSSHNPGPWAGLGNHDVTASRIHCSILTDQQFLSLA